MVANGFHSSSDEEGDRQLSAFPIPIQWLGAGAHAGADNHIMWMVVKIMLLFTAVLYIASPGFFDAKKAPQENAKGSNSSPTPTTPSPASPLKDRSHAWLTAVQTVWVPHHNVGLELIALGVKSVKLSLRRMIGWERYRMITGTTEEHEQARIKSWTIALEAQLAGGDVSVNHSRLLLTLLASFTLPATTARLMLNALHIRVLFFDLGNSFQGLAARLSAFYWLEARHMSETSKNDTAIEQLPNNLIELLKIDASDVFDAIIIEKAYNLAYEKQSAEDSDEGMNSVVKDFSIRSPLDALAAWYSSLLLQRVLVASMNTKAKTSLSDRIRADLDIALGVAPINSAVHLRALTAKGILFSSNGIENPISEAMQIFDEDFLSSSIASQATAVNFAVTTTTDIRIAIRCGMVLNIMKTAKSNTLPNCLPAWIGGARPD